MSELISTDTDPDVVADGDTETRGDAKDPAEPPTAKPKKAKAAKAAKKPGTEKGGTEKGGTEKGGTEKAGTEKAGKDKPERLDKAARLEAKAAKLREEQAAAERAARQAAGGSPRGWQVATAVLALLLVAAVVVGGVLFATRSSGSGGDPLATTRTDVLGASRAYAVDFGSYDYRHLDADFAKVGKHLTASFAKSYKSSSDGLAPTIVKFKGRSTATVQGVALSSVSKNSATALVFLDQTVTSSQSKTPRIDRNRLQMKLVRQHGTWLISDITLK